MGNECALRIIKDCFFDKDGELSSEGREMIVIFATNNGAKDFLQSLVSITIDKDNGLSDNAILRVLQLVRMMLQSGGEGVITQGFTTLPNNSAETFLTSLLLWKGGSSSVSGIRSASKVRKSTEEMILAIPELSSITLPYLIQSVQSIDPNTDGSDEFFSVLLKLVRSTDAATSSQRQLLTKLGTVVCVKLATYSSNSDDTEAATGSSGSVDSSTTSVLCGCLQLLIALIEADGNNIGDNNCEGFLVEGSKHMLESLNITPWSKELPSNSNMNPKTKSSIDLMGCIFDGFISSSSSGMTLPPICSDDISRGLAFNVVKSAAQACSGDNSAPGYEILSSKIDSIISRVAPTIRHKWGQNASVDGSDHHGGRGDTSKALVKYCGLKNQGCTCYMNSVLQQLFMMPGLRSNICSALLPNDVRSTGSIKGNSSSKNLVGKDLVGKKISVHWENGNKYDATVEGYNEETGMHRVSYIMVVPAQQQDNRGRYHQGQQQQETNLAEVINLLPKDLDEEYILTEGRPGKETGVFDILNADSPTAQQQEGGTGEAASSTSNAIAETADEATSRRLLEEVQRTLINLSSSSRTRSCFDPRSLVEASHCLKLEFDVWQQNDASEFAMKLLDRLEISLKKWSPVHFRYLGHTFGMKITKQKICRECGLKVSFSF